MVSAERRRRRRRLLRPRATIVVAGLVVLLVVVVLVGGALQTGSQSKAYWRSIDRSYALVARPVVEQSDRLDSQLRALLRSMAGETRASLQAALDTLVRQGASLARQAATAASPPPYGGSGAEVTTAMQDRASALDDLRSGVDGLLGMSPLPVAGSATPAQPGSSSRHLSVSAAAAVFSKAGTLLGEADRAYAAGRRVLHTAPGGAALPSSVWSGRTDASTTGGMQALAATLASSGSLAPVHDVVLSPSGITLTPAPVPPVPGAPVGVAVVPPTGSLTVDAVIANKGNVDERGIVVTADLAATGAQPVVRRSRGFGLSDRSSVSVTLSHLHVVPGGSYTLTVSVAPPVPDIAGAPTTATLTFQVAPPSPPVVLQVTPVKGRERGGADVTIFGSGFSWVSAVKFGSAPARFKVVSTTQITAVAPPGKGTVSVTVVNSGGTSAANGSTRFTYRRR